MSRIGPYRMAGEPTESASPAALSDRRWVTVRQGLTTVFVAMVGLILLGLAGFAIGVLGGFAGATGGGPAMAGSTLALVVVVGLVAFGLALALIVGQFMCCAAPPESGAKGLAIGAVVLWIGAFIASCAGGVAAQPIGAGIANLLQLGSTVAFVLFLRQVGVYLEAPRVSGAATGLLVLYVVLFAAGFFALAAARDLGETIPPLLLVLFLGLGVAALIAMIWWIVLVKWTRDAIAARLAVE